jgi:hypothetical protein
MTRVVLVPGVLALLPEYAGIEDPVAELRAACLAAVSWLGREVTVLAGAQGARVADHLLEAAEVSRLASLAPQPPEAAYLVVGNGSAKRTEKAPGHFDERAEAFDAALGESLRAGQPAVDVALAGELWADVDAIVELGDLDELGKAQVDYDDAPYGVQYWVMRWSS